MPDFDPYSAAKSALIDDFVPGDCLCEQCFRDPCRCTECFDCCETLAPEQAFSVMGRLLCERCHERTVGALRASEGVRLATCPQFCGHKAGRATEADEVAS